MSNGNDQQCPPSYGQDRYGHDQYGQPLYGDQGAYGEQAQQAQQASYGDQPYQEPQQYPGVPAAQDPYSTQTWQGQTWDTQYQPVQQAQQAQDQQFQAQQAQPFQAPAPAAADTAYLPQQSGQYGLNSQNGPTGQTGPTGSLPLPPEVPVRQDPAQAPAVEPSYGGATGGGALAGAGVGPQDAVQAPAARVADPYDLPSAPAYSSPATRGNPRVTDAQRARAEGRSPVIEPGMRPALLTAVLAALLAGAAAVGPFALVVPVVLLQAVTAAGWFRLNGMWPARQGIALAFLGGLVADVAILAVDDVQAPAAILGTLGVWVLLTVVLHLRNRMPADERMYALTAGVTTAALTVVAAGHLAADPKAMTVGGLAVAVAVVARALPLPTAASVGVALLAAAGAGVAAGGATGLGADGALIGLGAGVCALVGHRVASYDYPSKFVHMTAGVALPLALAAPAVYLLGRAFV
ncbi:hypothetical protein ACIQM4_13280 [Streptomyces sp. NPDC091272]|uniref:hypothetical protein n=1 Tax=Streptomyces sp. NPDC091272 TaxID=3365981 RepID=UPI0038065BE9